MHCVEWVFVYRCVCTGLLYVQVYACMCTASWNKFFSSGYSRQMFVFGSCCGG